jgi:hypothetical protein
MASSAGRPEESIAMERERAELWLWRAAIEDDWGVASPRERVELDAAIAETAREAAATGLLVATNGDFAVNGTTFRHLRSDQQELIGAVAEARLHALNWVCGFGESWDAVPLDI